MPEATHKITVEHDPHETLKPWKAIVTDRTGFVSTVERGATQVDALEQARAWVRTENSDTEDDLVQWVDAQGLDAVEPPATPGE
jgi:hypothetical protein